MGKQNLNNQQHLKNKKAQIYRKLYSEDSDEDREMWFGSHQKQSNQNKVVVYSIAPDTSKARFLTVIKNKKIPNFNTQLVLPMKKGMDQELSSYKQRRSPSEEIDHSENSESLPSPERNINLDPNYPFSQNYSNAIDELSSMFLDPQIPQYSYDELFLDLDCYSKFSQHSKAADDQLVQIQSTQEKGSKEKKIKKGNAENKEKQAKTNPKNVWTSLLNTSIKAFLSKDYLNQLCTKFSVDADQVKNFYNECNGSRASKTFLCSLFSFKKHPVGSQERKIRQCFHQFLLKYLDCAYHIYIQSEQARINDKQLYHKTINSLRYELMDQIEEEEEEEEYNCSSMNE